MFSKAPWIGLRIGDWPSCCMRLPGVLNDLPLNRGTRKRLGLIVGLVLLGVAVATPAHVHAQSVDASVVDAFPVENLDVREHLGEEHLGVECVAGQCVVRLAAGGFNDATRGVLTWRVAEEDLDFLPDGGLAFLNEAVLQSPWGEIRLLDVELRLVVDREYRLEEARGAAQVEFPTVGSVALFRSLLPARAAIGYESGIRLDDDSVALNPERQYLYFDLEAGRVMGPRAEPVDQAGLELVPGQKARVLVDPANGMLFVDGQLMLYSYGQGALIEHLLAGELETFEWSLDALPLRQILILDIQSLANGVGGEGPDEPFFRAGGEYSVDAGALGEWLRIEGTPLLIGGDLSVDGQALLLTGRAASSLFPEQFLLATVDAELLLPFEGSLRSSRVMVAMGGALPWAGVAGEAEASLTAGLDVEAAATLITHWRAEPVIYAVHGATGPAQIWDHTQAGWQNMTGTMTQGYNDVVSQADSYWSRWGGGMHNAWDVVYGSVHEHTAGTAEQLSRWTGDWWRTGDNVEDERATGEMMPSHPATRISQAESEVD